MGRRAAANSARAHARRSMNRTRFASPVRSSWRASCWSFSSASLRAVMSDCEPAIRDGLSSELARRALS